MKIQYQDLTFRAATLLLIEQAATIVKEYAAEGYDLTLRQLYYQFVARGLLKNSLRNYKRLGEAVSNGRLAGLLDWNAIVDRTRSVRQNSHWDSGSDILRACAGQFRFDLWSDQEIRPEVWVEKEALVGIFEPVCQKLDIACFPCRGFVSQSVAWRAGQRFASYSDAGQVPVVLHFGDHDPSGIDMTRDIRERLELFTGEPVEVRRLALNMEQVEEFNPPPNPAKLTDSRVGGYLARFGSESWELDALDPKVMTKLVEDAVADLVDEDKMEAAKERQQEVRERLTTLAQDWKD